MARWIELQRTAAILAAVLLIGCKETRPKPDPATVGAAPVPDSIAARQLADFRASSPRTDALTSPVRSRDELLRAFEKAVRRGDEKTLTDLAITRDEFAWLYYPNSPMSRAPYSLEPDVMWTQIQAQSRRGIGRLIAAYKGKSLGILSLQCTDGQAQGPVTLYRICRVFRVAGKDTVADQLFGSIIAVDGRFKFVGYSNKL